MDSSHVIDQILKQREICVKPQKQVGQVSQVTIVLPDLENAPRHVWGDWGPMYSIDLTPKQKIEVKLDSTNSQQPSCHTLDVSKLHIESPMKCSERKNTPFVMKLHIPQSMIDLHLYFDNKGHAARADFVPAVCTESVDKLCSSLVANASTQNTEPSSEELKNAAK